MWLVEIGWRENDFAVIDGVNELGDDYVVASNVSRRDGDDVANGDSEMLSLNEILNDEADVIIVASKFKLVVFRGWVDCDDIAVTVVN